MRKLFILLSGDREKIIELETFDFATFDKEMKNNDGQGIVIGDNYFWKIDVRQVSWYEENTNEDSTSE